LRFEEYPVCKCPYYFLTNTATYSADPCCTFTVTATLTYILLSTGAQALFAHPVL